MYEDHIAYFKALKLLNSYAAQVNKLSKFYVWFLCL